MKTKTFSTLERIREYIYMCPSSLGMAESNWNEAQRLIKQMQYEREISLITELLECYIQSKTKQETDKKALKSLVGYINFKFKACQDLDNINNKLLNQAKQ